MTYIWNLKYDTHELTQMQNRLVVAKGKWGWGKEGVGVWG